MAGAPGGKEEDLGKEMDTTAIMKEIEDSKTKMVEIKESIKDQAKGMPRCFNVLVFSGKYNPYTGKSGASY